MLTIYIISITLLIVCLSYFLGISLIKILNIKLDELIAIPLGFFSLLGINQFFIYFFVLFKIPTFLFFINYIIITLLIIIYAIHKKHIEIKIPSYKTLITVIILFSYVLIMVYQSAQRTLGSNGFDTVHYMSMVLEGSTQEFFGYVQFDNGLRIGSINVQYDFQSYYYFGSFLLFIYERINQFLSPSYLDISSSIFIWTSSVVYFINSFLISVAVLKPFYKKNKLLTLGLLIFTLFFSSNFYYTNTFTFYGNTYRTLILVLIYKIFYEYTEGDLDIRPFSILFFLLSSALIAVSSSGFFISAMALFAIVLIVFKFDSKVMVGKTITLLSFPTLLFAIFYLTSNEIPTLVTYGFILGIFYSLLIVFDLLPNLFQSKFKWFLSYVLYYGLPIIIFLFSIYLWKTGIKPSPLFFDNHKKYDMVWYFFDTKFLALIINIVWFSSLIVFSFKNKSRFSSFLKIILLTFINPISYIFVYRYLASVVYYRSYELIFNTFTLSLMIFYTISIIKSSQVKKLLSTSYIVLSIIISFIQINSFYNPIFIADEKFSSIYKIQINQIEPLRVLKTKILLENYDNPIVVSQIEAVRAYVDVFTPIGNETIRGIDKFKTVPETSKLLNIFINRDFYNQKIFDQEPDYVNTCKYLIDSKVDFVIVNRNTSYEIAPNQFEPLYFRIRECATEIYTNEDYIVYQFYW